MSGIKFSCFPTDYPHAPLSRVDVVVYKQLCFNDE
ncbi:hypothetical protein T01_3806 [Trichinella spiralis]|uniref:Uncharacterized protein n=1 Tax=Trichinella spiralis TaxID=6334 RepID=A0A0V0XJU7_TRISP|nr:hypothetical protein T01_118 [Trichinella spiralis]KRY04946.1 hypothetical protein T01_3806 [Trichinella spiralis]